MSKGPTKKGKHGESLGRCLSCTAVLRYCHVTPDGMNVICPICKEQFKVEEVKGGK